VCNFISLDGRSLSLDCRYEGGTQGENMFACVVNPLVCHRRDNFLSGQVANISCFCW